MSKVALITGAAKRVGHHVALAMAQRGYSVAVHYRSSEEAAKSTVAECKSHGADSIAVQADLTDEEQVQAMVKQVMQHCGQVDLLVNCAAVWESKPLEEVRAKDLRFHLEANVVGTFLCCREVGLIMAKQDTGGSIINIGDWAIARPYVDYAAYFPSKGAIPALTRSMAVELGTRNPQVRVNCIHPGPVMLPTDMSDKDKQEVVDATLVKREGSPEHIAEAVLFLTECSFVTGTCVDVDGGRTVYAP